jgi:hypothetical protein
MQHNIIKANRRVDAEAGVSLLKRRRWFDGDGDQNANAGGDSGTGGGERKFTQAELDGIVKDRVKRARETAAEAERQRILGELETDDLAAAKQLIVAGRNGGGALKERDDKIATLSKERDDAIKARDEALQGRRRDKRMGRLETGVFNEKALDAADVIDWLEKNRATELAAAFDDNDQPIEAKVKELIDAAKKAKPHWFKPTPGSPSNAGGRTPTTPNTPAQGVNKPTFNL